MSKILLINDTRMGGHHGSSVCVNVIFREFDKRGIAVLSHLQDNVNLERAKVEGIRAVVINGEGTMHSGQKNSRAFSKLAEKMHEQGVPTYLINTVYSETTPEVAKRMQYFTEIYCREGRSADMLMAQGVPARVCPDLTYAMEVPPTLRWTRGSRTVVLDSTVAATNRALHAFARKNRFEFQSIRCAPQLLNPYSRRNWVRLVRFRTKQALCKILPHIYEFGRYANATTSKDEFLRRLANRTNVVVAARFHGVCMCLKLGVPFIAVASNTPKCESMLTDAGLANRMVPLTELNFDTLKIGTEWTIDDEAKRLDYLRLAEAKISEMFDRISSAVA